MSDLRISQLPAVTALSDTDVAPISQLGGSPATRRASLAQLRPTIFDQNSVHVRDYGAVGNGATNDAPAIQAAINALKGMGGGVVRFGPRIYRLASAISIDGVAVRLEGAGFTEGPGPQDGTWLKVDTTGFTPITFTGVAARGSVVRDIAVAEAHTNAQVPGWTPTGYDWFFRIVDCFGGVDFDNVFLSSVNKGFLCFNSGRTDFRRIRGQVFTCGIEVDQALDVPRLQNIHFWPFFSADTNVIRWQQANGDAMVFKRADGPFIDQAFVLGYRSMFRFTAGAGGFTTKFYIGSGYADFCRFGVLIDSSGVNGLIANFTSQGEFWAAAPNTPIAGSAGIFISGSNAQVQIGNLRVDTVEDNAIRLGGNSNRLDIFALRAVTFNTRNNGSAAIQVDNAASGTPNRVYLGTPPLLEGSFATLVNNTDGNGVVQGRAPAGSIAKPGLAVGQDNSGMAAPSGQSLTLSANGAEMLRITEGGAVTLGGPAGAHGLQVTAPPGAANRFQADGAVSGGAPVLFSVGGDANIPMVLASKGNAAIIAQTGGGQQLQVQHQANSVNVVQIFGSATGTPGRVGWQAAGTDANISAVVGQPKGNGALLAQAPDGAASGGNLRGAGAVDLQTSRGDATQVASGSYSAVLGGGGNTASNSYAAVLGGTGNYAIGYGALALGGAGNVAGGNYSIAAGNLSGASGAYAISLGHNANSLLTGKFSYAGAATFFGGGGDAMAGIAVIACQTADATATRLTANRGTATAINTLNLQNFCRSSGVLTVTAGAAGSTASATWRVNLSAVRGNGAGTVVVFEGAGTAIAPNASQGSGSAWRLAVAPDTTQGGIAVSGTGAAATTINWVAKLSDIETVLGS